MSEHPELAPTPVPFQVGVEGSSGQNIILQQPYPGDSLFSLGGSPLSGAPPNLQAFEFQPGPGMSVQDLPGGGKIITTELPGGKIGVTWLDPQGFPTREDVYDSATGGGGPRGPTQAELEIMRGNLKVAQDQLKVNEGILAESTRSNLIQEGIQGQQLGINQGTLDELIRSAMEQEEEASRNRALMAASNALTGYLRAAELSDARRLASLQMQRDFLPFQVDPNKEFFGGGPEGSLATASRDFGLNFQPTPIQHQIVDPGALVAPGEEQAGPILGAGAPIGSAIEDVTLAGQAG